MGTLTIPQMDLKSSAGSDEFQSMRQIECMKFKQKSFRMIVRSFFVLLTVMPSFVYGQADSLRKRPDVLRFADGVVYTVVSPARWDGRDWLVLGGFLAGTAALTMVDQPVHNFWGDHNNRFLDGVERVGYHYGKPYSAVAFTGGFYLAGMLLKNQWAKETGLMLGTSIFSSSLVMSVLKSTIGRRRPVPGADPFEFSLFNESPEYHSFPSGHSSVAFGISIVLAKRIDNVPLKIFFYSLAGTTVVSRMYSDSHWLSDMAFGGVLAWFCADTAMTRIQSNRFRKVRSRDTTLVWKVYPYPGGLTLKASIE